MGEAAGHLTGHDVDGRAQVVLDREAGGGHRMLLHQVLLLVLFAVRRVLACLASIIGGVVGRDRGDYLYQGWDPAWRVRAFFVAITIFWQIEQLTSGIFFCSRRLEISLLDCHPLCLPYQLLDLLGRLLLRFSHGPRKDDLDVGTQLENVSSVLNHLCLNPALTSFIVPVQPWWGVCPSCAGILCTFPSSRTRRLGTGSRRRPRVSWRGFGWHCPAWESSRCKWRIAEIAHWNGNNLRGREGNRPTGVGDRSLPNALDLPEILDVCLAAVPVGYLAVDRLDVDEEVLLLVFLVLGRGRRRGTVTLLLG